MILTTIPILDVDIELTYPDDTTEIVTLEAPNGEDPFRYGFRRINILGPYRDGNYTLQKGFEKYQFFCQMSYESHSMVLWKLLSAKVIKLRIPPVFSNDTSDYMQFRVMLENEQVIRNWLQGFVIAGSGSTIEEANPIPAGNTDLNFIGVTPFTKAELVGDDPNPDEDDEDRPIYWEQTYPEQHTYDIYWKADPSSTSNQSWRIVDTNLPTAGIAVEDGAKVYILSASWEINLRIFQSSITFDVENEVFYDGVPIASEIRFFAEDGCDPGSGIVASGSWNDDLVGDYLIGGPDNFNMAGRAARTGGFNVTTGGDCTIKEAIQRLRVYIPEGFIGKQDYSSGSTTITVS